LSAAALGPDEVPSPDIVVTAKPKSHAPDELTLYLGGSAISGWNDIRLTLRAEGFPNDFDIGLSSRGPGGETKTVVQAGQVCTVKLGDDLVITGYVDRDIEEGSAVDHRLGVVGRGKTEDLVDCSAEWPNGMITGANALEVATKLAKPYGITVGVDPGPAIPQFNLNYGESAAEIIQRVTRSAGLLAYEDATGTLILAQAGKVKAASGATYGGDKGNVQSWSVMNSMDQRYSEYVCSMLSQDIWSDTGDGGFFFDTEKDPNVPRHRLMYLVMEQAVDPQAFTIRKAKWEAARRAGRATQVRVTLDSWRDSAGKLWAPNTLIPVDVPGLRLTDKTLAISEVTFSRSDEMGTTATLLLMPPAGFLPEPINLQPVSAADVIGPDVR
jgi:prophage tail gpP-like protein